MNIDLKEVEADLKYFTGCALTGLLANNSFNTPNAAKYLDMKGLSLEKLAVLSAVEVVSQLEKFGEVADKKLAIVKEDP